MQLICDLHNDTDLFWDLMPRPDCAHALSELHMQSSLEEKLTRFKSFGAKFQTFVVCFVLNKISIGKKFICKVERLNVK